MTTPTAATSSTSAQQSGGQPTMRAVTIDQYGSPDVIAVSEINRPSCGDDEVVLAVRAASVNPYDWHMMTGTPLVGRAQMGLRRPKSAVLGEDVAGVVAEVGANVTRFAIGDEVFGGVSGGLAEYVAVGAEALVRKPRDVSFEQAAAVPVAALTAVQGLRDHGRVVRGQRVLINGAAGGVGTFAIQLAKHFGAEVTGVCSTRNVDMVRELGADRVVDYTSNDFTVAGEYDLILDNIGNRKISQCRWCLAADGTYVVIGGPKGRVLGPLKHVVKAKVGYAFRQKNAVFFIARHNREDLELFRDLLESGEMRSVIDTTYSLDETPAAMAHLATGHARGKILVIP